MSTVVKINNSYNKQWYKKDLTLKKEPVSDLCIQRHMVNTAWIPCTSMSAIICLEILKLDKCHL